MDSREQFDICLRNVTFKVYWEHSTKISLGIRDILGIFLEIMETQTNLEALLIIKLVQVICCKHAILDLQLPELFDELINIQSLLIVYVTRRG